MANEIIYKINSKPLHFIEWLNPEAVKDMLIILKGFLHYIPLLSSLKGLCGFAPIDSYQPFVPKGTGI
jgi:hypothetical protein